MKRIKDDNYIEIGYKFRIYPTEEQKAFLKSILDVCGLYIIICLI